MAYVRKNLILEAEFHRMRGLLEARSWEEATEQLGIIEDIVLRSKLPERGIPAEAARKGEATERFLVVYRGGRRPPFDVQGWDQLRALLAARLSKRCGMGSPD
jgi:hypothetical protein